MAAGRMGGMGVLRDYFEKLYRYDAWANHQVARALAATPETPPEAVAVATHLVAAELVWLRRLRGGDSSSLPVWPEPSAGAVGDLTRQAAAGYAEYLDSVSAEVLETPLNYRIRPGGRSPPRRPRS